MNIILLSGGSGKRLWPLSNETRSKQFLKLLKNDESQYESMVQRVYRQILEVVASPNVVIATGSSQVDAIRGQLGDKVDLVVEPERRDTFPAIMLSAAYLAFERGVPFDEPVLVLPVDPYADMGYFRLLRDMEEAVRSGFADMVLMGMTPTYPSEKYGYILPVLDISNDMNDIGMNGNDINDIGMNNDDINSRKANGKGIGKVGKFIEKPSVETARLLIERGALWNGGVFAFRLGYVMDIYARHMGYDTYQDVYEHYNEFKKTSFDYEVVEKAESVAVMPYSGTWKDMGTWNTITEEMGENYVGDVTVGEGIENTHIINELNIPIVALGTEGLIIAASPDGILVSDKAKSSYIKPYVDRLGDRPMYEELRWGEYKVLDYVSYDDGVNSLTKYLTVKAGKTISYRLHNDRDEVLTVVDGEGELLMEDSIRDVRRGDVVRVAKGQKHAIHAITDLHFIEVQIGGRLVEEDVEEFEVTTQ